MRAEVIAIGDELVSGRRLDTNSQWLSQQLEELGIPVVFHTTVGDDLDRIADALSTALRRCDVLIISGGLGPTADDLTRQALALCTGRPLRADPQVLEHIRQLFAQRQRVMPESNLLQAQFPAGSAPIPNPHGTAPGISMEVASQAGQPVQIFALPGVPAEMREMWTATLHPALSRALGPARRYRQRRMIHCFGAGESEVERLLPDMIRRGRQPSVGITASQATISLCVTADGESLQQCAALIEPTAATIYQCLGDLVFGEAEVELQDALARVLAQQGRSLATAEWGTAGLVAGWLGQAADGLANLPGGVVVRDLRSLHELLGVEPRSTDGGEELDPPQLVIDMARAVRGRFATDFGLAVGPFPNDPAAPRTAAPRTAAPRTAAHGPSDRVHLAVVGPACAVTDSMVFAAHPAIQRPRCAKQALNLARLTALGRRK
jgi:nicotinamide-nucleotide amidase